MTTAFDVVIKELEERRETIAQALISGAAKDFAEYKFMTGEVQGLSRAHAFITDLVKRMENDDDR
jgi:hypothetical protein